MKRLPRSLDETTGLRAARWIRESTPGQFDRYGPESQHANIEAFIERYGLVDMRLVYTAAHSGTTVWQSDTMAAMLADAGRGFDLLLVGYFDRWQRNVRRTLELIEDRLHPAGAAWIMCDRRLLSSNGADWREMRRLANEAQEYSERLGERITDGYRAKFARHADQGGLPPYGFRRPDVEPHTLEIDPATIDQAVHLFERYALGTVSIEQLAREAGLAADRVRYLLRNPLFNGWMRRHRGPDEERRPAAWRAHPPVTDGLWARVEEVRAGKTRGGGPRNRGRVDLLAGLLWCSCGRRIRTDGRLGNGPAIAKLRTDPCVAWGPKARLAAWTWEGPLMAQVEGLRLDEATLSRIVAALSSSKRPTTIDRGRIERAKRELALDHAADRISDETYLARLAELRAQASELEESAPDGVEPARAVEWLRIFAETWRDADVPAAKADLLHAVYDRVTVEGPTFAEARLTPAAYSYGMSIALPEAVMARPAGFEPAT